MKFEAWAKWLNRAIIDYTSKEERRFKNDTAIASFLGISLQSLHLYLDGERRPYRRGVTEIAKILDADIAEALQAAGYPATDDEAPATIEELIALCGNKDDDSRRVLEGLMRAAAPPDPAWAETIRALLVMPWPLETRAERIAQISTLFDSSESVSNVA